MPIDYTAADQAFQLSFGKLNGNPVKLGFPKPGELSRQISTLLATPANPSSAAPALPHQNCRMLASAGIEMWHRAIHSFLLSVALTEDSPIWASNSGYYASHFVMRAFAHSMGIFKSFTKRVAVQVVVENAQFLCKELDATGGEHSFYWRAVKGHPSFIANPLFRENQEREDNRRADQSDALHRNFATYSDHLDSFKALKPWNELDVAQRIDKISRIRRHSVTAPTPQRSQFPDIDSVQILAFQRIVAFHDFLEVRVPNNRFWRAHRNPSWCKGCLQFQVEEQALEELTLA